MNLDKFLTENITKPQKADSIDLEYEGIKFHVYGILHGLIGGTNKEYRDFINKTIKDAKGLKLGEKSMQKIYSGLDGELEDWIQMTKKDTFFLTFKLFFSPLSLLSVISTLFKESFRIKDKFNIDNRRLQDIGGSTYFHLLDPKLRRRYTGFPTPQKYFEENYNRRNNNSKISAIIFPDPDWRWLTSIEKYVNIPYRSIHMLEFAVLEAKKRNISEVSLFIGEIHNTDIEWYSKKPILEPYLESEINKIKIMAKELSSSSKISIFLKKLSYLSFSALAIIIPMIIFLILFCSLK